MMVHASLTSFGAGGENSQFQLHTCMHASTLAPLRIGLDEEYTLREETSNIDCR